VLRDACRLSERREHGPSSVTSVTPVVETPTNPPSHVRMPQARAHAAVREQQINHVVVGGYCCRSAVASPMRLPPLPETTRAATDVTNVASSAAT
jgi:hypothetical protein